MSISQEDFLQTGFPSQYSTFGDIYLDKNPYVYCFCYCVYFFCCVAKRRDRYVVKSLGGKKAPSIIYMASIAIIERPTSLSGKSKKECVYDFLRSSLGNSLSAL